MKKKENKKNNNKKASRWSACSVHFCSASVEPVIAIEDKSTRIQATKKQNGAGEFSEANEPARTSAGTAQSKRKSFKMRDQTKVIRTGSCFLKRASVENARQVQKGGVIGHRGKRRSTRTTRTRTKTTTTRRRQMHECTQLVCRQMQDEGVKPGQRYAWVAVNDAHA